MFCNLKVLLDEVLKDIKDYCIFLWKILKEVIKENNLLIDMVFEVGGIIDFLLDYVVYFFSLSYVYFY